MGGVSLAWRRGLRSCLREALREPWSSNLHTTPRLYPFSPSQPASVSSERLAVKPFNEKDLCTYSGKWEAGEIVPVQPLWKELKSRMDGQTAALKAKESRLRPGPLGRRGNVGPGINQVCSLCCWFYPPR